jgi:hypothetical protein
MVIINEGVLAIGAGAFSGCTSLKEMLIPYTVKSIGTDVFTGCKDLVISVMLENKGEYPTWPEGWNGACEVVWIEELPADTELGGGEKDSESDNEQDGEDE